MRPRLEYFELTELIAAVAAGMESENDGEGGSESSHEEKSTEMIRAITLSMSGKLEAKLTELAGKRGRNGSLRFMALVGAALILLLLLMAVLVKLFARAEKKAKRTCEFPDVLVGERLGAVYGGGKTSSVHFGSSRSSSSGQ